MISIELAGGLHSGRRLRTVLLVALCCGLASTAQVSAQMRPVVVDGATVFTGNGPPLEHGTVIFQGGKISAVGAGLDAPFLAEQVKGHGKYVTPGWIDLHSTLGLDGPFGGGMATARSADAFDRYSTDELRAAWQQGITTIYLPARAANGIGGQGAVIRLCPRGATEDVVLEGAAALCLTLGAHEGVGPIGRVQALEALRQQLQAAKDYRESWEDYEENIKEYEEKLAERAKKAAEAAPPPAEGDKPKGAAAEKKKGNKKKAAVEKKEGEQEKIEKPSEPGKDRNVEILLKVLDGDLRLRVEAYEPADIVNALQLAEEFHAALIIEGAGGADLLADRLAEAKVPVVLSAMPQSLAHDLSRNRTARPEAAAVLQHAGVDVYWGSGVVLPETAPHLALRVAQGVGAGYDGDAALEALTGKAARLLGVEDKIGQLRAGLNADLVIWSDHPLAAGARVERVYIGGQEVYNAERNR